MLVCTYLEKPYLSEFIIGETLPFRVDVLFQGIHVSVSHFSTERFEHHSDSAQMMNNCTGYKMFKTMKLR